MRILLTNDDGIDAPGLAALFAAVQGLGEVHVVAPVDERSASSHSTTAHGPIVVQERGPSRWAVDGTPADCVRLGLTHLVESCDLVLSGINRGGNLGVDVHLSGTVAAAREAALMGRRAAALSHYVRRDLPLDWDAAAALARRSLEHALEETLEEHCFWNINLPHREPGPGSAELVLCPLDPTPLPIRYEMRDAAYHFSASYHQRPRLPAHDVDICFNGDVAISRVCARPA